MVPEPIASLSRVHRDDFIVWPVLWRSPDKRSDFNSDDGRFPLPALVRDGRCMVEFVTMTLTCDLHDRDLTLKSIPPSLEGHSQWYGSVTLPSGSHPLRLGLPAGRLRSRCSSSWPGSGRPSHVPPWRPRRIPSSGNARRRSIRASAYPACGRNGWIPWRSR